LEFRRYRISIRVNRAMPMMIAVSSSWAVWLLIVLFVPSDAVFRFNSRLDSERFFPVGEIMARGTSPGGSVPSLTPDEYILSTAAEEYGLTLETALMDGGTDEWPLFEAGKAPGELLGDAGPELIQRNDPSDRCAGGDIAGFSILNVTDPTLVTFVLPEYHPGRTDIAVIIAPGGGNRFLSWTKEGTSVAKWFNSIGISAFVLKYRVPANTFETGEKTSIDAQRAVSLVRHRASGLGLNTSRIGFMGFSAGGGITADVSTATSRSYEPADDADEFSFHPDFALMIYASGNPFNAPHAPPTFIAGARNDPCVAVEGLEAYFLALQANQGNHELHVYNTGQHGYGDCTLFVATGHLEPVCAWTLNAQLFIDSILGIQRPLQSTALSLP